jgi:hypothetical protein
VLPTHAAKAAPATKTEIPIASAPIESRFRMGMGSIPFDDSRGRHSLEIILPRRALCEAISSRTPDPVAHGRVIACD